MIIKYNSSTDTSTVTDIFKYIEEDNKIGQVWVGEKDSSIFYEKKTVTYGEWNFIQIPETINTASWDSNLEVSINGYAERTNSIRKGFTYSTETEREYAVITIKGNTNAGTLTGTSGETGYKFIWNTYDNTTSDRTVTLVATCNESNVTKEIVITQKARDKYVTNINNITITGYDLYNYSTLTISKVNSSDFIIPACGGKINKVYYEYTVAYNTSETVKQTVTVDLNSDNTKQDIKANSLGTTEKDKSIITTVSDGTLGTITIENITENLIGFTVYQEANIKTSNNDAYTLTKSLSLSSDKEKIYVNGGDINFTVVRTYDQYSDTYTYTSGDTSDAVLSAGKTEKLTSCDIDVTGGATDTFNNLTYTISKKEIETAYTFKAKYIGTSDTEYHYSNEVIVTQYMDAKKDGSDEFKDLEMTEYSYSNVSDSIAYTFSAAGGTLKTNDENRVIVKYKYTHNWIVVENGVDVNHTEEITGIFTDLTTNEYSFDKDTVTANNLGDLEITNTIVTDVTITITPYYNNVNTGLIASRTVSLTQEGNSKDSTIIEGSEVSKSLVISCNPTTLSYSGGDVTLKAIYYYTVKYKYTSGTEKEFDENKDVTTEATWYINSVDNGIISTGKYNISSISENDSSRTFVFKANYKLDSKNEVTVTQSAVAVKSDVYKDLKITGYSYNTISGTDYHILASGGNINATDYSVLTAQITHEITYENGQVDTTVLDINLNDSNINVTYDKSIISGNNLGTNETTVITNLGTFKVTINGIWDTYALSDSKASNIIYQQINKKSDTYTKRTFSNVKITEPTNGYKIPTTGETVNFKLIYSKIETYSYTSGYTKDFTTDNIDGTSDTYFTLFHQTDDNDDFLLQKEKQSYYTFSKIDSLIDYEYYLWGNITLDNKEYSSDTINLSQTAKTISYYKDLVLTLTIENDTLSASGGTAYSSDITGKYTYTIVYDDNSEDTNNTVNITSTTNGLIFDKDTITYDNKGTTESDNTKVSYNSSLTTPQYFTGTFTSTTLKDNNGNYLTDSDTVAIYQEANNKKQNKDEYVITEKIILSVDKDTVYVKGDTVNFTVKHIFTEYANTYTYTSGVTTSHVITTGIEETLSSCNIDVTGGATGSFSNLTYTIPEKTIDTTYTFTAKYKGDADTDYFYNSVEVKQLMDAKVEGSDTFSDLKITDYSYSNISIAIPYTYSAAGGSLYFDDKNRISLIYSYVHTYIMKVNGVDTTKTETINCSFTDLSEDEYSFKDKNNNSVTNLSCFNLLTTDKDEDLNVDTITVTIKPSYNGTSIGLSANASTTLTQQGNKMSTTPVEGSEVGTSVSVTCSPNTLTYTGGTVTLKAIYYYTVKYKYTSGEQKEVNEEKDITKTNEWYLNGSSIGVLSNGTYDISTIDKSDSNKTFIFKTTYNSLSDEDTVTQSTVAIKAEIYNNLQITEYEYNPISVLGYHISASGGTINATDFSKLTITIDHVITYENGDVVTITEPFDREKCNFSYSKTSITADSLGTTETSTLTDLGTFTITARYSYKISNTGLSGILAADKESNTIYQQINERTLVKSAYNKFLNNNCLTIEPSETTVLNAGGEITYSLTGYISIIRDLYSYTSGSTYQGPTSTASYVLTDTSNKLGTTTYQLTHDSSILGTATLDTSDGCKVTIDTRDNSVLTDKTYTLSATVTLSDTSESQTVYATITQKGDVLTKTYYENISTDFNFNSYIVGTSGQTSYHFGANGITTDGTNSITVSEDTMQDKKVEVTKVEVYEQQGEKRSTVTPTGNWVIKPYGSTTDTIVYANNLGTTVSNNNCIAQYSISYTTNGEYVDINGNYLSSIGIIYKFYQQYNILEDTTNNSISVKKISPDIVHNRTSSVVIQTTLNYTETYTSGSYNTKETYVVPSTIIAGLNVVDLMNSSNKATTTYDSSNQTSTVDISKYMRDNMTTGNVTLLIKVVYSSLNNIIDVVQYGDIVKYSDLVINYSYPTIGTDTSGNAKYHIAASGGTITCSDGTKAATCNAIWMINGITQQPIGQIITDKGTWTFDPETVTAGNLGIIPTTANNTYTITYTFTPNSEYGLDAKSSTYVFVQQMNQKVTNYERIISLDKSVDFLTNNSSILGITTNILYNITYTSGSKQNNLLLQLPFSNSMINKSATRDDVNYPLTYSANNVSILTRDTGTEGDVKYVFNVSYYNLNSSFTIIQYGDTLQNLAIKYDDSKSKIQSDQLSLTANNYYHFYAYPNTDNSTLAETSNGTGYLNINIGTDNDINISTYVDVYRRNSSTNSNSSIFIETLDITDNCEYNDFDTKVSVSPLGTTKSDVSLIKTIKVNTKYGLKSLSANTDINLYQQYNILSSIGERILETYTFNVDPSILNPNGDFAFSKKIVNYKYSYPAYKYTSGKYTVYNTRDYLTSLDSSLCKWTYTDFMSEFYENGDILNYKNTISYDSSIKVDANNNEQYRVMYVKCNYQGQDISCNYPISNTDNIYKKYQMVLQAPAVYNIGWDINFPLTLTDFKFNFGYASASKTATYGTQYKNLNVAVIEITSIPNYINSISFNGWYTEKDGGELVSESTLTVTQDTTLYAHWNITCKITWTEIVSVISGKYSIVEYNSKYSNISINEVPICNVNDDMVGYVFDGWYTKPDGEGGNQIFDSDGNIVEENDDYITSNTTLYAHYVLGTSKITLITNNIFNVFTSTSPWYNKAQLKNITFTITNNITYTDLYNKYLSTARYKLTADTSTTIYNTSVLSNAKISIILNGWYASNSSISECINSSTGIINTDTSLYAPIFYTQYKITYVYNYNGSTDISTKWYSKGETASYKDVFSSDKLTTLDSYCIGMSTKQTDTSGYDSSIVDLPKTYYLIWEDYVYEPTFLYMDYIQSIIAGGNTSPEEGSDVKLTT